MIAAVFSSALLPFCAAAASAYALVRHQERIPLIDRPNQRSSHSVPKPRSGGIAVALGLAAAFAGSPGGRSPAAALGPTAFAAAGFFVLGLADDFRPLPELARLCGQVVLAAWVVGAGGLRAAPFGLAGPAAAAFSVFWVVGFVNVFNFMDGVDGIALSKACLGGAFIVALGGGGYLLPAAFAAAGLLLLNFPPSRIFLGDGGSYLLGFLLAAGCMTRRPDGLFVARMMPLGSFLFDAGVTLLRRAWSGERWYKAHRSHFYQRATDLGFSHRAVTAADSFLTLAGGCLGLLYARGAAPARALEACAWAGLHLALFAWITRLERSRRPEE